MSNAAGTDLRGLRDDLDAEVADLEARLAAAKARRSLHHGPASPAFSSSLFITSQQQQSLHSLLLLADSALPLGSFAFSSGLESYLAHQKLKQQQQHASTTAPGASHPAGDSGASAQQRQFHHFLRLSMLSLAGTALPFVTAAYRAPQRLPEWDDAFDAVTLCNVARRASVAQGKGLLGVWGRSFSSASSSSSSSGSSDGSESAAALAALQDLQTKMRAAAAGAGGRGGRGQTSAQQDVTHGEGDCGNGEDVDWTIPPSGHYPPLWGAVTLLLGLSARDSAYLFLFSHLRTVVSAAVRASVLGPYQAQAVLSSTFTRELLSDGMEGAADRRVEDVGQVVPVMDLWMGRHEILYSRIFNS